MDFTYVGNGVIQVGGCSPFEIIYQYYSKFSVGNTVYNRPKALKGIFRKHTIKEIRAFPFENDPWGSRVCQNCTFPPMYIDTYNQYHNEEDLISYEDAVEIVTEALRLKAIDNENAALKWC